LVRDNILESIRTPLQEALTTRHIKPTISFYDIVLYCIDSLLDQAHCALFFHLHNKKVQSNILTCVCWYQTSIVLQNSLLQIERF
jgi:hypothetical protein